MISDSDEETKVHKTSDNFDALADISFQINTSFYNKESLNLDDLNLKDLRLEERQNKITSGQLRSKQQHEHKHLHSTLKCLMLHWYKPAQRNLHKQALQIVSSKPLMKFT
jgi:hypothetical protein